jgi:putative flippase GtrA
LGGISTLIHFTVASLYIYFIDSSVFQSNIVGFLVAYVFSYLMQSKYVFEHQINIEKAIRYFIVQFGALLLAIIASTLFDSYNSYIRTTIVVVLLPLITFLTHKVWTFKKTEIKHKEEEYE